MQLFQKRHSRLRDLSDAEFPVIDSVKQKAYLGGLFPDNIHVSPIPECSFGGMLEF